MAPKKLPPYDSFTAEEVDALNGHEREAWYAHRRGDDAKAAEILATYDGQAPARIASLDADDAAAKAAHKAELAAEVEEARKAAEAAAEREAAVAEPDEKAVPRKATPSRKKAAAKKAAPRGRRN